MIVFSPDGNAETILTMYDGADVYCLTRNMVVEAATAIKYPNPSLRFNLSNGVYYASSASISSGKYPYVAPAIPVRFIWLAFLSDSIFGESKSNTFEFPAPWENAQSPVSRSFRIVVKQSTSTAGSPLPMEVVFLASSNLWNKAVQEQIRPEKSTDPFPDGSVGGVYRVNEWTNLSDSGNTIQFPLNCQLERYWPPKTDGGKAVVAERYICEVKAISLAKPSVSAIDIPDKYIDVFDGRFQDEDHPTLCVVYRITNSLWKTTNDVDVQRALGPEKAKYNYVRTGKVRYVVSSTTMGDLTPKQKSIHRFYAIAICSVAFLSLPLFLLIGWIRKKRKQSQS